MKKRVATVALLLLSILPIVLVALSLPHLPDQIPMHYGIDNQIDRWGSKYQEYILAAIFSATGFFMLGIGKISVKLTDTQEERYRAEKNEMVCILIGIFIMVFFCILQGSFLVAAAMEAALGSTESLLPIWKICGIGIGALYIAIGWIMPKCEPNNLVGVRTSQSMSSKEAWEKSQKIGGRAFLWGGIACCALSFLFHGWFVFWVIMGITAVAAAVACYGAYRAAKSLQS